MDSKVLGSYLRWVLAAFSLATAGIHFAYAPDHFAETWYHGAFFVALAWCELLLAFGLIVKPKRQVFSAGLALSLLTIGVWTLSRTVGLPIGPMAGEAEPVAFPDALSTCLEVGIALGCAAWLFRPALMRRPVRSIEVASGLASAFAMAAILIASAGVSPSLAGEHSHSAAAGGHDDVHDATPAAATGSHDAAHDAASHDQAGTTAAHDMAGMDAAATPWTGNSPCEQSGPPSSPGQANQDAEGHNHRGPMAQQPIDQATQIQLAEQQKLARSVADRYPTVADAEAAGYRKSTVFVPCIGAHYTNNSLVLKFDPAAPSELLYDGTNPDSKIIGLSFLLFSPGGAPDGFAGPNDQWHQHSFNGGLCMKDGLVVGAEKDTDAECAAKGGKKASLKDLWMVHDWIVPGWECSWGVFAAECPELGGRTGGTAFDPPAPGSSAATSGTGSTSDQAAPKPGG